MDLLKQSTAITVPFFAHDVNGDGVTGIADGSWTKRISKNGGAFAAMTVTVTEMENGWYSIPLSTAHTDTVGYLGVSLSAAAAKRVNMLWRVSARLEDDLCFPTTTGRSLDVTATGAAGIDWGNIENPTTAQNLSATNIDVDQVVASVSGAVGSVTGAVGSVAAGGITASSIATGAIDADALASDAVTEIRSVASGTSDSGSTTTMVDAARTEGDTDYWKGDFILFTSGTIAGQCRFITGFNAATDTITFAPATTQAVGTQTYEILPQGRVDLQLWLGDVVNALVSGRVDTSVGAMAAGVVTAAAVATDAIDGDAIAASAVTEIQSGLATSAALATVQADTDDIQTRLPAALVSGRMDSSVGAMAAGVVTAAAVATGAIDADALATDAVTEIRSLVSGTSDSGSTTTMVDAARTEADTDYWKGAFILFTSGTISGQCRLITAFDAGTDTITFAPATTQAVGTQTYEILHSGRVDLQLWLGSVVNALVSGRVDSSTGAMAAGVVTATAVATDAMDADALAADALAEIKTQVVNALTVDTYAESSGVVAATATLKDMLNWLKTLARNRVTMTSTTQTLRNDANSADVATSAQSDDGTTYVRGEWA